MYEPRRRSPANPRDVKVRRSPTCTGLPGEPVLGGLSGETFDPLACLLLNEVAVHRHLLRLLAADVNDDEDLLTPAHPQN